MLLLLSMKIKKLKLNYIVKLGRIFILSMLLFIGIVLIYGLMTLLGAVIPVNQGQLPYSEIFDIPLGISCQGVK